LIEEEKKTRDADLQTLLQMKAAHQEKVKLLNAAIKRKSQRPIPIGEVPILREQLLELKHSGKYFRNIMDVCKELEDYHTDGMDKKVVTLGARNANSSCGNSRLLGKLGFL